MDKKQQWHAWYFFVAALGVLFFAQVWALSQNVAVIPYSQFLDDLNGGKIAEVRVSGDTSKATGKKRRRAAPRAL